MFDSAEEPGHSREPEADLPLGAREGKTSIEYIKKNKNIKGRGGAIWVNLSLCALKGIRQLSSEKDFSYRVGMADGRAIPTFKNFFASYLSNLKERLCKRWSKEVTPD